MMVKGPEPEAVSFDWGGDIYADCQHSEIWPEYADEIHDVAEAFREVQHQFWRYKEYVPVLHRLLRQVRTRLADLLCFPFPEHVVFTTGAFHSLNVLLRSMMGSKIAFLTSSREIPQTYQILYSELPVSASVPVCSVVHLPVEAKSAEMVQAFAQATKELARKAQKGGFTLVLFASWITYDVGLQVPLAEIASACRAAWNRVVHGSERPAAEQMRRSRSRLLIVGDLAHVVGNIDLVELLPGRESGRRARLDGTELDAVVGDAHKWLQGANQSGFLLPLRRPLLDRVARTVMNMFALDETIGRSNLFCSKSEMVLGSAIPMGLATDRFKLSMKYRGWGLAAQRLISRLEPLLRPTGVRIAQLRFSVPPSNIITLECPDQAILDSFKAALGARGIQVSYFGRKRVSRLTSALAHLAPPEAVNWIVECPFIRLCVSDLFNSPGDEVALLAAVKAWADSLPETALPAVTADDDESD